MSQTKAVTAFVRGSLTGLVGTATLPLSAQTQTTAETEKICSVGFLLGKTALSSTDQYSFSLFKILQHGMGAMTQGLAELAALPENMNSVPRTHVWWCATVCNSSSKGSDAFLWPPKANTHVQCMHTCACAHTHVHVLTHTHTERQRETQGRQKHTEIHIHRDKNTFKLFKKGK